MAAEREGGREEEREGGREGEREGGREGEGREGEGGGRRGREECDSRHLMWAITHQLANR